MISSMYKRVLLKISGEMLAGKNESGIDAAFISWLAKEVSKAVEAGVEIAIVVGGGNYLRGAQIAGSGITRVNADFMGMLATVMNGLALADIFNKEEVPSAALSNIKADQAIDHFTHRRALNAVANGKVVIIAGGIGRPYLTTDTSSVSLALELGCDVILKATKVDGVYDKDPAQFNTAKKYDTLSYREAVENDNIKVMDKAALALAMEQNMPVIVFKLADDAIVKAVTGQSVGTRVS